MFVYILATNDRSMTQPKCSRLEIAARGSTQYLVSEIVKGESPGHLVLLGHQPPTRFQFVANCYGTSVYYCAMVRKIIQISYGQCPRDGLQNLPLCLLWTFRVHALACRCASGVPVNIATSASDKLPHVNVSGLRAKQLLGMHGSGCVANSKYNPALMRNPQQNKSSLHVYVPLYAHA